MQHGDILSKRLSPCPFFFTCVCSRDNASARHRVEPFVVSGDPAVVFGWLKALLAGLPRTIVVTATEDYLHAICRTRLGFADDIEFRLCPTGRVIHVRSAARISFFSDFGVNRRRLRRSGGGFRADSRCARRFRRSVPAVFSSPCRPQWSSAGSGI